MQTQMVINVYTSTLHKLVSYGNLAISVASSMQMEADFMLLRVEEGKLAP